MPNVYLGVAGGYLHSNIDEHSSSSSTQNSARFALYGVAFARPSLFTATVDGTNFPVAGITPSRSQLIGGLGLTVQGGPNLSLDATYDAVLPTGNTTDQTVQAGLRWRF